MRYYLPQSARCRRCSVSILPRSLSNRQPPVKYYSSRCGYGQKPSRRYGYRHPFRQLSRSWWKDRNIRTRPTTHLQPYEVGLDRAAGSGYLPENDMSGIVGVMPGHGDTERPVTARIPIAATLGGRTYLYRGRTRSSETCGHDIIHADTESPDSSPDKITRQCIDIP